LLLSLPPVTPGAKRPFPPCLSPFSQLRIASPLQFSDQAVEGIRVFLFWNRRPADIRPVQATSFVVVRSTWYAPAFWPFPHIAFCPKIFPQWSSRPKSHGVSFTLLRQGVLNLDGPCLMKGFLPFFFPINSFVLRESFSPCPRLFDVICPSGLETSFNTTEWSPVAAFFPAIICLTSHLSR